MTLFSCDKSDNPPSEVSLVINREYLPVSLTFDKDAPGAADKYGPWDEKTFVINSAEDIPEDPLGFTPGYAGIDFSTHTLLLRYEIHRYTIGAYSNSFIRKTLENNYNWTVIIGCENLGAEIWTKISLTRFAILVPKLRADATVLFWLSLYNLNGDDWLRHQFR